MTRLKDAAGLRCPHLAFFGGAVQLVPVADSVRRFTATACAAGRPRRALTVEVFPEADHRLHTGGHGTFAPGYLSTLVQWIKNRNASWVPPRP